jgi:hypothetical protein
VEHLLVLGLGSFDTLTLFMIEREERQMIVACDK